MSQVPNCTLVVNSDLYQLVSVLQDANLAQVEVDDELAEGEVVIKGLGNVVVCPGPRGLDANLLKQYQNKPSSTQESTRAPMKDPVLIVLISPDEFWDCISMVNSLQLGKPLQFYFAKEWDEIPQKVLSIAYNMQNQQEFKDFMCKTKSELQAKLLQLY